MPLPGKNGRRGCESPVLKRKVYRNRPQPVLIRLGAAHSIQHFSGCLAIAAKNPLAIFVHHIIPPVKAVVCNIRKNPLLPCVHRVSHSPINEPNQSISSGNSSFRLSETNAFINSLSIRDPSFCFLLDFQASSVFSSFSVPVMSNKVTEWSLIFERMYGHFVNIASERRT